MKVLILTNMYPNPVALHSGIWLHQIVKGLQRVGYEFRVVFSVPHPPFPFSLFKKWNKFSRMFPDQHKVDGVQIDFLRYYSSFKLVPHRNLGTALMLSQGRNIYKIMDEFKPDLLWAQPALPNGWAAMRINKKLNLPYVILVLGADINESINFPGAARKLGYIYETAASVISLSQRLDGEVRTIAPKANRQIVCFGIDFVQFKEATELRRRYLLEDNSENSLRMISVSNLIETKGIQYNIHALSKLIKRFPTLEYVVVGEGVYGSELKRLTTQLGLENNIRFLNKLNRSEVLKEFAHADIFTLPSYKEGLGLVYMEGMALGLPVVGVKGQGIEDVIDNGKTGFLVEPRNTQDLIGVLEQLLTDAELRKTIGMKASRHIQQNFTWDATTGRYDEILKAVVAGKCNA